MCICVRVRCGGQGTTGCLPKLTVLFEAAPARHDDGVMGCSNDNSNDNSNHTNTHNMYNRDYYYYYYY